MARRPIDIGTLGNDGTGDSIRDAFRKVNDNFRELYGSLGLGENLSFVNLEDTPDTFAGQENSVLAVGIDPTSGREILKFKQIIGSIGVTVDSDSDPNSILINSQFSQIRQDPNPQLGGNLSVRSGGSTYKIVDLDTPTNPTEAAPKSYVDTKISRAGVDTIDPATNSVNQSAGIMTGPLVLSRDPIDEDDVLYGGRIAATKSYVDNAAFASATNLYVATSGQDERPGLAKENQGRALPFAFRTIEAALKRAEELMLASPIDLGPYAKRLTFNRGESPCTLTSITKSDNDTGNGYAGVVFMTADTVTLINPGTFYNVGTILTLPDPTVFSSGVISPAQIEVLSISSTPGPIITFRVISGGLFTDLPPNPVQTLSNSLIASGATFNVTYKVAKIDTAVVNGVTQGGSGYGLVSVRISDGQGNSAFGRADINPLPPNEIRSITITDPGKGFTTIPTLTVDLPTLRIFAPGRTDFTGDVDTNTAGAKRSRDIREGLFLKGRSSGALAQILGHTGQLDTGNNELFDVDIISGSFEIGEQILYGDSTKSLQISVIIESGIYEENFPLKIPENTAIIGNEFRRVLIKPRDSESSSPWAFLKFRRDPIIDGIPTGGGDWGGQAELYGYHYLKNPREPVYTKINNPGNYLSSAQLLELNRIFIPEEVVSWIDQQIEDRIPPFNAVPRFIYNRGLCKRDVGLILDSIIFDLRYGDYNRTVSAALKYFQNASGRIAVTTQLSQTLAGIDHLLDLMLEIIENNPVDPVYNLLYPQVIDVAVVREQDSIPVMIDLIDTLKGIIDGSGNANEPLDNDKLDVFLCNDSNILRAITCQGHGGFSMVLDPTGQILAKSPYAQEAASFSKSINQQTFAGGMFVDGFTGNLQFRHIASETVGGEVIRIRVTGLDRVPQIPCSFIVDDEIYRINYFRDFVYNKDGSSCTFILDETTPFDRNPGAKTITGVTVGPPSQFTSTEHRLQGGATIIFSTTGTLPNGLVSGKQYYVLSDGLSVNNFRVTDIFGSPSPIAITTTGTGTLSFTRIYEILMPGNRSMLSNDWTQVNDLGYGLVVTNGGLTEAVSMFTYYCHISYYALNGGQIRSIGGSSAHGNYALVAEGSDPLELPTPTTLYYDFGQRVICYFPNSSFLNQQNGLEIYVTGYDYIPNPRSELEIDHNGPIFRYPINSVNTEGLPTGVAKLNLTSDTSGNFDGLFAQVVDGTVMTVRQLGNVILTGNLVDVATRPSTGLRLNEWTDIYRVIQFNSYEDDQAPFKLRITTGTPATFNVLATITDIDSNTTCSTGKIIDVGGTPTMVPQNHRLKRGDKFIPITTTNGLTSGTTYYIQDVPNYDQFVLATDPNDLDNTIVNNLTDGTSLTIDGIKTHRLLGDYTFRVSVVGGSLPTGLSAAVAEYYVLDENLTDTTFQLSLLKDGLPINLASAGSGFIGYTPTGLTSTLLRENYNFIDLRVFQPGEYVPATVRTCTISIATPAVITTTGNHGFVAGDVIKFTVSATSGIPRLPTGLTASFHYFVLASGLTSTQFQVSIAKTGSAVSTTAAGNGTIQVGQVKGRIGDNSFAVTAVAADSGTIIIVSEINSNSILRTNLSHGLKIGDKVVPNTDDNGFTRNQNYFVSAIISSNSFTVSLTVGGMTLTTFDNGSGLLLSFSAFNLPGERIRVPGSRFLFKGEEYVIAQYESEDETEQGYARITLDRPLVDSIVGTDSAYDIKAAVPARSVGAYGNLTIRISLTRVTTHDMLEIGTGSYADTNYPNEIFGSSVNPFNPEQETQERDVGRVFYVTTDQFGNFNVGPFFRVDQGTGSVTFSAAIALSNLDGLGFKRGVPVSEFSTDSSMSDNAIDTVPTENAVRIYIDRRLGLTHNGVITQAAQLIPISTGGFMALDGQLPMKGNMNFQNPNNNVFQRITNLGDPVDQRDAVNLRSLTFNNIQGVTLTNIQAGNILAFTGVSNNLINASIIGDISLTTTPGDLASNQVSLIVNDGSITNAKVSSTAAIAQSKLSMNSATTRANATGITQADRGLASFNNTEFDATNGWISVKNNGITLGKLPTITTKTLLGNSGNDTANVSTVSFSDVIDIGLGIKKSQYLENTTNVVLMKTTGASSSDSNYTRVEVASGNTNDAIVRRSNTGGFSASIITATALSIQSTVGSNPFITPLITIEQPSGANAVKISSFGTTSGTKSSGGILLQDGAVADRKNFYNSGEHVFRAYDGLSAGTITTVGGSIATGTINATTYVQTINLRADATGTAGAAGTVSGTWTLNGSSRFEATYAADLAEYYEGDLDYPAGTVVIFGGEKEVTISRIGHDTTVAGVVSDNAAYTMNSACPGIKVCVALQGRVPCRVVGKIKKGDLMVTSDIQGVATSLDFSKWKPGVIIGKALQDYDSESLGTIEVAVGRT
jgi:hypothetical protein